MRPWERLALRARRRELRLFRVWRRVQGGPAPCGRRDKRVASIFRDVHHLRMKSACLAFGAGVSEKAWREAYYREHPRR